MGLVPLSSGKHHRSTRDYGSNSQTCPARSSGHSLHSLASSEMSSSMASCSTSLSTDTLYWDGGGGGSGAHGAQHTGSKPPSGQHQAQRSNCPQCVKPKSWDNLTTKGFGGYGFGYGYLDTGKTHSAERPGKASSHHHSSSSGKLKSSSSSCKRSCGSSLVAHQTSSHEPGFGIGRYCHQQTNKSTESLLNPAAYHGTKGALGCECLDLPNSARFIAVQLDSKHDKSCHASSGNKPRQPSGRRNPADQIANGKSKHRSAGAIDFTRL